MRMKRKIRRNNLYRGKQKSRFKHPRAVASNKERLILSGPLRYNSLAYHRARSITARNTQYQLLLHGNSYYLARVRGTEDPEEPETSSPDEINNNRRKK